jgi:hypothetical protein
MSTSLYIEVPAITKFNCNSVLYDAIGEPTISYISLTYDKENIYFLKNTSGIVLKYNIINEELSSFEIAINEPIYSILKYKDEIYGFGGYDVKEFVGDTVLYVKDNSELVQESYDKSARAVHLSSKSEIRDFFIDDNMNYYVVHNTNKISKFTKDRVPVYSFNIKPNVDTVFNTLGVMPNDEIEILKFDYVREYTLSGLNAYPIILGKIKNGTAVLSSNQMFLAVINETTKRVDRATFLSLTGNYYSYGDSRRTNYNLTNYNFLKNHYPDKNEFVFKIILQNLYNNKDRITVDIPISKQLFKTENHHFAFRVDGIEGKISAFLDGKEVQTVDMQKGQYVFQDIFDESIDIGNTYFHNNISLHEYLNQKNYYFIRNAKLKQFKMYKKALTNNEIDFHVYNGIKMDDLVVSLPCDQRNELDGIERQFKLDISGNKSNNINILIKNSNITNPVLQNKFKEIISERIKKIVPITTKINNIEFR